MKITLSSIKKKFGNDIFKRGEAYFNSGFVYSAVKFKNNLCAEVIGRFDAPYSVEINLETLDSDCSCPYSIMCKHAVAALLFYLNENDKVIDADRKFSQIEKLQKEELLSMLRRIAEEDPEILARFDSAGNKIISVKPMIDSFGSAVTRDFNFSMQQAEIAKLRAFMRRNVFSLEGKEKVRLCLEFLEEIKQYFSDVDDSNGSLARLVGECTDKTLENLDELDEKERGEVIAVLEKLSDEDEYNYFEELKYNLEEIGARDKSAG